MEISKSGNPKKLKIRHASINKRSSAQHCRIVSISRMFSDYYDLREARDDEKSSLMNFLRDNLHLSDTLLASYLEASREGMTNARRQIFEELQKRHEVALKEHPCLVAEYRPTGAIAGLCLVELCTRSQHASSEPPVNSELLSAWLEQGLQAKLKVDFFAIFPDLDTILNIRLICVVKDHRERDLEGSLLAEAVELAKRRRAGLVKCLLTSPYIKSIAIKRRFRSYADVALPSIDADKEVQSLRYVLQDSYSFSVMALKL